MDNKCYGVTAQNTRRPAIPALPQAQAWLNWRISAFPNFYGIGSVALEVVVTRTVAIDIGPAISRIYREFLGGIPPGGGCSGKGTEWIGDN